MDNVMEVYLSGAIRTSVVFKEEELEEKGEGLNDGLDKILREFIERELGGKGELQTSQVSFKQDKEG